MRGTELVYVYIENYFDKSYKIYSIYKNKNSKSNKWYRISNL